MICSICTVTEYVCPACQEYVTEAVAREREAALHRQAAAMRDALAELFDLVEGGWLVRNTTNDGHFPSFLKESTRLVGALSNARAVLRATAEGQP